jgi:hypothetical protein
MGKGKKRRREIGKIVEKQRRPCVLLVYGRRWWNVPGMPDLCSASAKRFCSTRDCRTHWISLIFGLSSVVPASLMGLYEKGKSHSGR